MLIFVCVQFGNVIFLHIWFFVIHFCSKMCTLLFCFFGPATRTYSCTYVYVTKHNNNKIKKLVNNMNNVENEANVARHSLSNKVPVSFIRFGIIDHQWWLLIPKRIKLIRALLVILEDRRGPPFFVCHRLDVINKKKVRVYVYPFLRIHFAMLIFTRTYLRISIPHTYYFSKCLYFYILRFDAYFEIKKYISREVYNNSAIAGTYVLSLSLIHIWRCRRRG